MAAMHYKPIVVFHSPTGRTPPEALRAFAAEKGFRIQSLRTTGEIFDLVNRTFPACVVMDTDASDTCIDACAALKGDTFSAIIPIICTTNDDDDGLVLRALQAGADEVLTPSMSEPEWQIRLDVAMNRADRDVSVHPSTRLPGTVQIERDIAERMNRGETFAVCYADLDHFKEFNDRYGYNQGDRVIMVLSRILRDVVKAHSPAGFLGHIGGDDFIFDVPIGDMELCCREILEIFDELIPYQYSPEDRRASYFLAKDRRGNIHRIPLMTLSIGVVTNRRRHFTHTARVSELATEMKSYAKTLSGSVFAVDRRSDGPVGELEDTEAPDIETSTPS